MQIQQYHLWLIDYGSCIKILKGNHEFGSDPVIVGSWSSPADSLWNRIRDESFDVSMFNRNVRNHEKDCFLTLKLQEPSTKKVLVSWF